MANPTIYPAGFLPYGTDDDSIVVQYPLTEQPTGSTLVGTTTSGIDFNDNGVLLDSQYGGIQLASADISATQEAQLAFAGTITMWVDSTICEDRTPGWSEYLFIVRDAGAWFGLRKDNGQSWFAMNMPGGGVSTFATTSEINKPSKVRIDITWIAGQVRMYIDHHLMQEWAWVSGTKLTTQFANFFIGGRGTFGDPPRTSRIKNFMLSTRPIMVPTHQKLSQCVTLGHSFVAGSTYYNSATLSYYTSASGGAFDISMGTEIHRTFNKLGYDIGGGSGFHQYAVTGSVVADLTSGASDQIAAMQAAGIRHPDFVYILTGHNDLSATVAITSQFKTDYQTAITELIALNPNVRILIGTMTTPVNYDAYDTQVAKDSTDQMNVWIRELQADNPSNVRYTELWPLLGTHENPTTSLFAGADNLHPSNEGYSILGKQAATDAIKMINTL